MLSRLSQLFQNRHLVGLTTVSGLHAIEIKATGHLLTISASPIRVESSCGSLIISSWFQTQTKLSYSFALTAVNTKTDFWSLIQLARNPGFRIKWIGAIV